MLGAAFSFAISYLIYSCVMISVSRSRSGKWIASEVLGWFVIAGVWLGVVQVGCVVMGGGWWGMVPTAIATFVCVLIYFRKIDQEKIRENG